MPSINPRQLAGSAGILLGLIFVGAVVTVVVCEPQTASFDKHSPEAAVQSFLQALYQENYEEAQGYLGTELHKTCTPTRIRQQARREQLSDITATLEDSWIANDSAHVTVLITRTSEPEPFSFSDRLSYEEEYLLAIEKNEWKLISAVNMSGPWPLYDCQLKRTPVTPSSVTDERSASPATQATDIAY